MMLDKMPFHNNCREGWGCHPSCPVRQLLEHARDLNLKVVQLQGEVNKRKPKMDNGTAADMVEDLQIEIAQLREQLRQLEAERDQWQTRAVNND